MSESPHVRPATVDDVADILALVTELAMYEREPDAVVATVPLLTDALFGPDPKAWALIAEHDGRPAGFVLWFLNFSTWEGRHGVYIEDLYVREEHRGRGYGRALFTALARLCTDRGYARLEWAVLDWNASAQGFYESLGAAAMEEWTVWRLTGGALATVAGLSP